MSQIPIRRGLSVLLLPAALLLAPVPVASADCTGAGDFGAASGCSAPGGGSSGSSSTESWPPTSVDWPPQLDSATGDDDKGVDTAGTPIVSPAGQAPPPAKPASGPTGPATPPKPIVPVGGGSGDSADPAPSAIVTPTAG